MATKSKIRARQGAPSLTANKLAKLTAGDHTDLAVRGLQFRVRNKANGTSRSWLFRYTWKGEWVRIVIGHYPPMSLAEARERAIELRRALDDGIDPRRSRPKRRRIAAVPLSPSAAGHSPHSIEYLASEFMERYVRPHRRRPEYVQAILDRDILKEWAGRDARTIKPREVIDFLDKIVDRGAAVLANRTASVLDQLFKFGIHRDIVEDSPVKLLMRPGGKERPRERVLSDAELTAFLKEPRACTRFERLEYVILILLLTGQRRGELAKARWAHVDFQARTWAIPDENSKTGRGHVVPLTDWAIEQFEALKREAEGSKWVLPGATKAQPVDPKQLTRSLAKCLKRFKKQGIAAFTLHDLRRTCRTGLSALKGDDGKPAVAPHIAERVLNHAQPGIAAVYDRFAYLEEKRGALEKWAARLRTLQQMGTQNA